MGFQAFGASEHVGLKVLDPDLPLLASQAAIELDNFRLNKSSKFEAVEELKSSLEESLKSTLSPGSKESFIDYGAATVVSQAFNLMPSGKKIITVEDLIEEAWGIVKTIDKTTSNKATDDELVVKMRDFFIALAKSATSYSHSIGSAKPPHPFKV